MHAPKLIAALALALIVIPTASADSSQPTRQQASAGTVWKEPNGRYSITIPTGWKLDSSAGNLKITNGDNWAIFDTTYNAGTPLQAAQKIAGQMQPMVGNWRVFNQGPFTTASHHASAGMTVGCSVPERSGPVERVMVFATQSAGSGNFVTLTASSTQATAAATNPALMQIFETVRFAGE